ncbi:hypothetical protein AM433_004749 [Pseudomonas aeruginosa]|nr:hypothetical protein AM433_004749 [Pseudomonas aeruginosa]
MALSDERRGIGARNEAIRRAGGQRLKRSAAVTRA